MKISEVMKNYFNREAIEEEVKIPFGLKDDSRPVNILRPTWEVVKEPHPMLVRDYDFKNYLALSDFINELLEYQEEIHHHGDIEIKHRSVRIKIYTHTLENITDLDRDYARNVDFIYEDTKHYGVDNVHPR